MGVGRGWASASNTSAFPLSVFLSFPFVVFLVGAGAGVTTVVDAPVATGPCMPDRFGPLLSGGLRKAHVSM